jgi:hypothetical protein
MFKGFSSLLFIVRGSQHFAPGFWLLTSGFELPTSASDFLLPALRPSPFALRSPCLQLVARPDESVRTGLRLEAPRSGISLRSTCIFSFVFPEKLVTFKPLKTKNKTAYATKFK